MSSAQCLLPEYFSTGKIVPPLCIYIPGIDGESVIGQFILVAVNLLAYVVSILITIAIDSLFCIIFWNMGLISSIIINHLAELRDALLKPECSKCEIKLRLIQIVLMHKKYNE